MVLSEWVGDKSPFKGQLQGLFGELAPAERRLLAQIVETADLIELEGTVSFLLVPTTPKMIETMGTFGAEHGGLEFDFYDEAVHSRGAALARSKRSSLRARPRRNGYGRRSAKTAASPCGRTRPDTLEISFTLAMPWRRMERIGVGAQTAPIPVETRGLRRGEMGRYRPSC